MINFKSRSYTFKNSKQLYSSQKKYEKNSKITTNISLFGDQASGGLLRLRPGLRRAPDQSMDFAHASLIPCAGTHLDP